MHSELKASLRRGLRQYFLTLGLVQNGPLTSSVGQERWNFYFLEENHSSIHRLGLRFASKNWKKSTFLAYRWSKRPSTPLRCFQFTVPRWSKSTLIETTLVEQYFQNLLVTLNLIIVNQNLLYYNLWFKNICCQMFRRHYFFV